jgi:hypothetical protein
MVAAAPDQGSDWSGTGGMHQHDRFETQQAYMCTSPKLLWTEGRTYYERISIELVDGEKVPTVSWRGFVDASFRCSTRSDGVQFRRPQAPHTHPTVRHPIPTRCVTAAVTGW